MASWGTPLTGLKTRIPEDQELKTGEKVAAKAMFHVPLGTTEGIVVGLIQAKYALFEPNFELKYVKASISGEMTQSVCYTNCEYYYGENGVYGNFPLLLERCKTECPSGDAVKTCELEIHCVVVQNPINIGLLKLIVGGIIIIVVVGFIAWTFWYIGETAGPAGIILALILGVVVVLAFIGVRVRG